MVVVGNSYSFFFPVSLFEELTLDTFTMQRKPWPVADWKFYIAFSLFRAASIYAGVYSRWILVSSQMLNKSKRFRHGK
jgi:hypothetical protein